jgi:hypothetical protein
LEEKRNHVPVEKKKEVKVFCSKPGMALGVPRG